jgi:hypothetical protein
LNSPFPSRHSWILTLPKAAVGPRTPEERDFGGRVLDRRVTEPISLESSAPSRVDLNISSCVNDGDLAVLNITESNKTEKEDWVSESVGLSVEN